MNTESSQPAPEDPSPPPVAPSGQRVKIGSQREGDATGYVVPPPEDIPSPDTTPPIEEPVATVEAPPLKEDSVGTVDTPLPEPPPVSFPPPRVESIPPDLEDEINEALAGVSIDEMLTGGASDTGKVGRIEPDERYPATVVKVHRDNIFFALPGNQEGVASTKQLAEIPEVGASLDVIVTRLNEDEGLYELRIPGAAAQVQDWSDVSEGTVVEARITGHNSGGLECEVGHIRGFIPVSQISLYRVDDMSEFVDQKLQCAVTEANPARRNLVLSRRAVLEREREEARQQLLESLEVGQTREGVVRNLRDFGAFVDLGGVDGLIHISQLSWDRVDHPSQVLKEGERVKVKIDKIDRDSGKIGLSYRDLLQNPWDNVQQKYPVSSIVTGTVTKVMNFGAFVRLEAGVEGLIHISELAWQRVHRVDSVVSVDQEVEVKVLSVDRDAQRISLSLKAAQAEPASDDEAEAESAETEPAPAQEPSRPARTKPLKGGTDRPSGGENFGLRW